MRERDRRKAAQPIRAESPRPSGPGGGLDAGKNRSYNGGMRRRALAALLAGLAAAAEDELRR